MGSCTPYDNPDFSRRITKARFIVLDYLAVHELAHLLEPNHSRRFWTVVAVQVPHGKGPRQGSSRTGRCWKSIYKGSV